MKLLDFIFKREHTTASHLSFRLFGIKLNFLKPQILKERKAIAKYYQSFENAQDIPKATGDLRLVQEAYCGFLKQFNSLCAENNLNYWIDFGTLIGALRHKGFIPWDDDVDISMPREDYEKLISILNSQEKENSCFNMKFENNFKNKCFIKIKYKKSANISIDIFPYDFYYTNLNDEEKMQLSLQIEKLRKRKKKFKTQEDIRENIKKLTKEIILKNNATTGEKPALFMGLDFPHAHKNKVFDWEDIFPVQKAQFENIEINIPNNSDSVLKKEFGNYMSIPKDSYPRHSNYGNINEDERKFLEELRLEA